MRQQWRKPQALAFPLLLFAALSGYFRTISRNSSDHSLRQSLKRGDIAKSRDPEEYETLNRRIGGFRRRLQGLSGGAAAPVDPYSDEDDSSGMTPQLTT